MASAPAPGVSQASAERTTNRQLSASERLPWPASNWLAPPNYHHPQPRGRTSTCGSFPLPCPYFHSHLLAPRRGFLLPRNHLTASILHNVEGQAFAPIHRRSLYTRPVGSENKIAPRRDCPAPTCCAFEILPLIWPQLSLEALAIRPREQLANRPHSTADPRRGSHRIAWPNRTTTIRSRGAAHRPAAQFPSNSLHLHSHLLAPRRCFHSPHNHLTASPLHNVVGQAFAPIHHRSLYTRPVGSENKITPRRDCLLRLVLRFISPLWLPRLNRSGASVRDLPGRPGRIAPRSTPYAYDSLSTEHDVCRTYFSIRTHSFPFALSPSQAYRLGRQTWCGALPAHPTT